MATIFRQLYVPLQKTLRPRNGHLQIVPKRTMVYNESGGILNKPKTKPYGFITATIIVVPLICVGQFIGQKLANVLEEYEIFIPDDDDD